MRGRGKWEKRVYSTYVPFDEYSRFSGFRSLCAMFMSWRYLTAMQMSFISSAASGKVKKILRGILVVLEGGKLILEIA